MYTLKTFTSTCTIVTTIVILYSLTEGDLTSDKHIDFYVCLLINNGIELSRKYVNTEVVLSFCLAMAYAKFIYLDNQNRKFKGNLVFEILEENLSFVSLDTRIH